MLQRCFFKFAADFTIVINNCFFVENSISFNAIIFLESLTWVVKRTNKVTSFTVIKIYYCRFPILEYEEMLFYRTPKCRPELLERYKPDVLTTFLLNDSHDLIYHPVILIWLQILFFLLNWIKVCWLFNSKSTCTIRFSKSL